MAKRVREMIAAVRDICLEYDATPFDNDYIVRKIQFAFDYIYNHFVKSNESLFHRYYYFQITAGKRAYPIPRQAYGRRVERLEVPSPPQYGSDPYAWIEIPKYSPRTAVKYDAPRTRTLLPSTWTQRDNKIEVFPQAQNSYKARLVFAMRLPVVAWDEGAITSFSGNIIRLDDAPSPNMHNALAMEGANYLSICCGETGRLKKVYPFEAINGREITLSSSDRATLQSFPITSVSEVNAYSVTFDPLTGTCTLNTLDDVTEIEVGNYIEIAYGLEPGKGYNIDEALTDDSNFYNPPEFNAPSNPFPRAVQVTAVTSGSISFSLPTYTPSLSGGYKTPHSVTTGNVISAVLSVYSGQNVLEIELDTAHGFAAGEVYRILVNGTGIVELDGVDNKVYRVSATKLAVLSSTLTGVFVPGTWALHQYIVTPDTGLPPLTEVAVTNPQAAIVKAYKNTPYSFTLYPEDNSNNPDAYDINDNIEIGDIVSLGYSMGINPLPEAYDEAICLWAGLPMRSSMNETDSVGAALLKEIMTELKGDLGGRNTGIVISRDFARRSFNHRAYRSRR